MFLLSGWLDRASPDLLVLGVEMEFSDSHHHTHLPLCQYGEMSEIEYQLCFYVMATGLDAARGHVRSV